MNLINTSVIKRDGSLVPFDAVRIETAIKAAAKSCNIEFDEEAKQITDFVVEEIIDHERMSIEEIQTRIEGSLMLSSIEVATAYIQYRHERDIAREKLSKLSADITGLIDQTNVDVADENANKDSKVIPTQRDLLAGIVAKHYALKHILPPHIAQAHESGDLHYHDLDYSPFFPMFNCFSRDTKFITTKGVFSFEDFEHGDGIEVPSHKGENCPATVKSYGKQMLNRVIFKRGKGSKVVHVTGNHRWLTARGEVTDLRVGDKLIPSPSYPAHLLWAVESIEEYREEEVWCLEVERDHSFILDGGMVTGNCMLVDLKGMLENGFKMGNAEIASPKSIATATAVTAQIVAQVASHIYGGTTIHRIDEVLAPYVTISHGKNIEKVRRMLCKFYPAKVVYEGNRLTGQIEEAALELTEKECYDAFQSLEYEVNTLN